MGGIPDGTSFASQPLEQGQAPGAKRRILRQRPH